jgi:hypothetical protein
MTLGADAVQTTTTKTEKVSTRDGISALTAPKTYVTGGTTPNSTIQVQKPKKNMLLIGAIAVIGIVVAYKYFIKKK